MRLFMSAAVLATFFAVPAHARDGHFYVGGDLGLILATDSDLEFVPGGAAGSTGSADLNIGTGFDGGIYVGHDLGPIRLEAEASYRTAGANSIDSNFTAGNGATISAGKQDADGKVKVLSFMGNAMLDIGDQDAFSFFIGGGAGYAKIRYDNIRRVSGSNDVLDDGDWRFAWQATAGVRKAISSNVDATLRYRFFNANGKADLIGVGGRVVDDRFRSHSLMAGVTFNF